MMQQVASAKAEVAAFAALSGTAEPSGSALGFDQVLQQQRDIAPPTSKTRVTEPGRRDTNQNEAKPSQAQSPARKTESNARRETAPESQHGAQAAQKSATAPKAEQQAATPPTSQSRAADGDELDKQSAVSSDDEQLESDNADRDDQWLELVWSLQGQVSEDEPTEFAGEEIISILSAEELQAWLQSQDDKLLALSQLIGANPTVQTWLAEADLSQYSELQTLAKLALSQDMAGQGSALTPESQNQLPVTTQLSEELSQIAKDISDLININRLSPAEIKQLNLALSESFNNNVPLAQDLKNMLQSKLNTVFEEGAAPNNAAAMTGNNVVPDDGSILIDTEQAKMALAAQAAKDSLQALLDKINGADKNLSQAGAAITIQSEITSTGQSAASTAAQNKVGVTDAELAAAKEVAQAMLANNPEMKALANLSDDDAESVLSALAQKIAEWLRNESSKGETKSPLVSAAKLSTDGVMVNSDAGKDMLAALKTGLDEFKQQLAVGHEPGLDLKALVAQALEKNADPALAAKVTEGLDKTIRSLANSLTAINQLSDSGLPSQVLSAINLDNQTTQAEQYKAMQLQQADNKLDKAINLNKPESHQQLADKVRWMVNTGNLVASIRLDPAELGSMHVKVSMTAESATVNFVVQSAQTRDALEAATPRLREMLAEKGIELGQSAVKQDAQSQQNNQEQSGQQANGQGAPLVAEAASDDDSQVLTQPLMRQNASSKIDYFV